MNSQAINYLARRYPMFKKDYPFLVKIEVITSDLDWKCKKISLAQYFSWICGTKGSYNPFYGSSFWEPIEVLITARGERLIRGSLTRLLSKQKCNSIPNAEFEEIQEKVLANRERLEKRKQAAREAKKTLGGIKNILREYYGKPRNKRNLETVISTAAEIEAALKRWRGVEAEYT